MFLFMFHHRPRLLLFPISFVWLFFSCTYTAVCRCAGGDNEGGGDGLWWWCMSRYKNQTYSLSKNFCLVLFSPAKNIDTTFEINLFIHNLNQTFNYDSTFFISTFSSLFWINWFDINLVQL